MTALDPGFRRDERGQTTPTDLILSLSKDELRPLEQPRPSPYLPREGKRFMRIANLSALAVGVIAAPWRDTIAQRAEDMSAVRLFLANQRFQLSGTVACAAKADGAPP